MLQMLQLVTKILLISCVNSNPGDLGSILSTFYAKRRLYFFALSGSACLKAAHKTIVKMTPGSRVPILTQSWIN